MSGFYVKNDEHYEDMDTDVPPGIYWAVAEGPTWYNLHLENDILTRVLKKAFKPLTVKEVKFYEMMFS